MRAPGETSTLPYTPPKAKKTAKPSKTRSRLPRPSGFQTEQAWMAGPRRSGTYAAYLSWWKRHQAATAKKAKPGGGKGTPGAGAGGGTGTGTGTTPPLVDDLRGRAESEIDAELKSQIDPLNTELSSQQRREAAAAAELNRVFGELQPSMDESLRIVAGNWDRTREAQQGIFSQAGQRLNQVKQDAANEAQALAQKIGGPVAVDQFTGAVDAASIGAGEEFDKAQIGSMGTGNVGVQELGDWVGKVFPLIRTEKQMGTRQKYEDEITKIRGEITSLQGQRGGLVNKRLNELQVQERAYKLQLAQLKLEQQKAAHDWAATQKTLHNDDIRLGIAQGQLGVSKYKAITGARAKQAELRFKNRKLTSEEKIAADKLGMSESQFKRKMGLEYAKLRNQEARTAIMRQKNANQIAKGLANPTSMKVLTLSHKVPLTKAEAAMAKIGKVKNAFVGKDGKFYKYVQEHVTTYEWTRRHGFSAGNRDPYGMFKLLKSLGYSPLVAANSVKLATGIDPRKKKK